MSQMFETDLGKVLDAGQPKLKDTERLTAADIRATLLPLVIEKRILAREAKNAQAKKEIGDS